MKKNILLISTLLLLTSCSNRPRVELFAEKIGRIEYILVEPCNKPITWSYLENINGVNYAKLEASVCVNSFEIKIIDNLNKYIVNEYDFKNLVGNLFIYNENGTYYIIGKNGQKEDFNKTMIANFRN